METKYVVKRNGPLGTSGQLSAAANFFAKSQQQQQQQHPHAEFFGNTNQARTKKCETYEDNDSSQERDQFPTNFRALVHRSPPPIPPLLLKKLDETSSTSSGKIKIFLRVMQAATFNIEDESNRFFFVDRRRKQVTLFDPSKGGSNDVTAEERGIGVAAPKMYAFDGVFSSDDQQEEVCSAALSDVISSVVANGTDGCVFCYGHANTGKSHTMVGDDARSVDMGVVPAAIAWLYRSVKERKTKTGARFSVRVSAMEITGKFEEPRDLLTTFASAEDNDRSPAYYLRGGSTDWIHNQTELRASSADRAAFYFDAALARRSDEGRGHILFTMHVYQYSVDGKKGGLTGGRSRLHLIDFGGCERTRLPGGGITLSGLGNVILGIFNGQKHLPHRESPVTKVLKDCLGSSACQAAIIAHVSPEPAHYSETLHTVQLASRLHRMKRRKAKRGSGGSSSRSRRTGSGTGSGHSSSDFTGTGTSTNASSSEFSCDTVVYRGGHSDGSGTDGEHPPSLMMSRGGSLDNIPRRPRSSKILTNGAISPRNCLSPIQRTRPGSSLSGGLPAIPEVVPGGKMPLSGLVPIQSSHRMRQQAMGHFSNYPQHQVQQKVIPAHQQQHQQQLQPQFSQPTQEHLNQQQSQLKPKRAYGFMDEHKVNMIHTWVVNSTNENELVSPSVEAHPVFRVLTQFKTADSDESSSERKVVQVHAADEGSQVVVNLVKEEVEDKPKKKQPPPPPPRRTPPRETKDNADCENMEVVKHFEPVSTISNDPSDATDGANFVVTLADTSCQVTEDEICRTTGFQLYPEFGSDTHPLRILSEENLTVVSSFNGSCQKLDEDDGVDYELEDPSRLSFFGVPDFSHLDQHCNGEDMISKKFQLLEQMQKQSEQPKTPTQDVGLCEPAHQEVLLTFPRTHAPKSESKIEEFQAEPSPPKSQHSSFEEITPQKNFYLLSQSLRHPDGSSNPELNFLLENQPQRSPGNGRSGSEDNLNCNFEDLPIVPDDDEKVNDVSHKSKRFAFRFLKIFSSTRSKSGSNGGGNSKTEQEKDNIKRSKSCDRKLEDNHHHQKTAEKVANSKKQSKSASSSPALKASNKLSIFKSQKNQGQQQQQLKEEALMHHHVGPMIETPSTMSLSTEWEFCNNDLPPQTADRKVHRGIPTNFEHIIIKSNGGKPSRVAPVFNPVSKRNGDRKSSGYDSLGGDESSSLDSSQDSHQSPQLPKQPPMTRISEMEAESIVYINQNHNFSNFNNNVNHRNNNNNGGGGNNSFESVDHDLGLVQYEEVDILRMDQQRGWRLFQHHPPQDKKSLSSFS